MISIRKRDYYRGVEDPISGTFKLAEEVSSNADKILFYSNFALVFAWFSFFVITLLMIVFLRQRDLFFGAIFSSIFVTGIITIWLLTTLRKFLSRVSFRYDTIMAMREGSPLIKVPSGKNMTGRFLSYLKRNNRSFKGLLKRRPEVLSKDAYLPGKSGRRHHFHAFVRISPSILYRTIRRGHHGYLLFIREYKKTPALDDLKGLEKDLSDLHDKYGQSPDRVVLLFKGRKGYCGVDDDIYDRIVGENITIGNRRINLQLVAELSDGAYEFIPFIPELPKMLP